MRSSESERSIAEVLTEDHDRIDALFQRILKDDFAALPPFKARLRAHMKLEEELLFPLLADPSLAASVALMQREHDRLRELLDEDDFDLIDTCLGSHNVKEERTIYPLCAGPRFAPLVPRIRAALAEAAGLAER